MTPQEFEEVCRATLADLRVSRSERRAVGEVLVDASLDDHMRAVFRDRAFAAAREKLRSSQARAVIRWLQEICNLLDRREPTPVVAECHFSPGEDCRRRIEELLAGARRRADICVFTITDNRLARSIVRAHRRGVGVRVISDDEKADDLGSDTLELRASGVPVAFDRDPSHMHHKFALFDGELLLSGSYNWTRSAFRENRENVLVTDDPRLVAGFAAEFEALWSKFA